MPTSSINLSTTAYVKLNDSRCPIYLQSLRDDVRIAFSDSQPAPTNSVFHVLGGNDPIMLVPALDTDIWAKAVTNTSGLVVTTVPEDPLSKIGLVCYTNTARTPDISAPTTGDPYLGDWHFNDGYNVVQVTMDCDVSGTLYFEFYDVYDDPTPGSTPTSIFPVNGFEYDGSGFNEFHQAVKGVRWFRVRFAPDSDSATSFRVNTYLIRDMNPANAPLNQVLGPDADATVVRTFPVQIDLALGKLGGVQQGDKHGYTPSLGSSVTFTNPASWVDLWVYGGMRGDFTGTFTPYLASSSVSDTSVGVRVEYLDANGIQQQVTVATNASDGRTPVSLGVTAQEVYRAVVTSNLVGNISIASANNFLLGVPATQSQVLAHILYYDRQTQQISRRIPSDKQCIISKIFLTLGRNNGSVGAADLAFQTKVSGGVWRTRRSYRLTSSAPIDEDITGIVLPPLTDWRVRIRDVSDPNTVIAGSISFTLIGA